ncbi:MAG: chromosomal replication initiator protein [Candidatus Paceibacteria bacterium]|jgi:chromosomal replication initiator protein
MPKPELHQSQFSDAPKSEEASQEGQEPAEETAQDVGPSAGGPSAGTLGLNTEQLADVWQELRSSIRARIQPEQFETWFRRAALESLTDTTVCIAVQNAFSRDWLNSYYREVIEEATHKLLSKKLKVELSVDPELTASSSFADPVAEPEEVERTASGRPLHPDSAAEHSGDRAQENQQGSAGFASRNRSSNRSESPRESNNTGMVGGLVRGSDVGLNPRYTFDNFVVGPCNRFSHAVSLGTAEAPGKTYNPLFLHGNVGLGKTHLLQSICYSLIENWADVRILFLSCETFVNHFISALENGDLQKFRGKYRNVDVLVVDDIHVLANKERTQEEFFHTFNSLYNAGKQIILSSDAHPKDIPTLHDRLISRFKWGLVTEIEPPCYETRMAILRRKGRDRGMELPDDVAQLIAERVDTNIRELEGTINKLYSFSNMTGQPITGEFCREVLTDLFTKRRGQPSMNDIIEVVTAHFGVKLSDLQSKKRTNQIAFPRQVAMYLARQITRHSLEEIGGFFGGRDHSTVLHAVRKLTSLAEQDEQHRDLIAGFLDDLQASGA